MRYLLVAALALACSAPALAQTPEEIYMEADGHFKRGEYREAVELYDQILAEIPNNFDSLERKGIAYSNMERHGDSLEQFFTILQYRPDDVTALTGMGLGFGNLGEYAEALAYLERAYGLAPNSTTVTNYKEYAEGVVAKYPYVPTPKPADNRAHSATIPDWARDVVSAWLGGEVDGAELGAALEYLLVRGVVEVSALDDPGPIVEARKRAEAWAAGAGDAELVPLVHHVINSGNATYDVPKTEQDIDREIQAFKRYVRDVMNAVEREKRYIEFPNPSGDVIKKFLRDYKKWNFEEEVAGAAGSFPDPVFAIIDDVMVIYYTIYINEQPAGLPLDHEGTFAESLEFWEERRFEIMDREARFEFIITDVKSEANVWVTWVVRNIGEGVLGHAHVGKGVVEVALGDYNCDGAFQLYDVASVRYVMTHELGHSIGLKHVEDPADIMYPSFTPSFAYCLI